MQSQNDRIEDMGYGGWDRGGGDHIPIWGMFPNNDKSKTLKCESENPASDVVITYNIHQIMISSFLFVRVGNYTSLKVCLSMAEMVFVKLQTLP